MKMKRNHLQSIPLFSELTNEEIDLILDNAREQRYPRGSIVFYEGDPGDFLMVVISGKVKVVLLGEGGQEIILAMLGPGNFFGEMAILESAPRSATVMTIEPSEFYASTNRVFPLCYNVTPRSALRSSSTFLNAFAKRMNRFAVWPCLIFMAESPNASYD